MAEIPFLNPALIGVGIATGVVWSAIAPERVRGAWWICGCAVLAAALAAALGFVPWFGSLRLGAYGFFLLLAFAIAWWIMRRRALASGIDPEHARVQLALAAITGILGARAWYVIEYQHEFPDPRVAFGPWLAQAADLDRGGAVWYGGLVLAMTTMVIHTLRARVPLVTWADCTAPAVLAGLAIGRIGCWFNGCCYGSVSDLPWAVSRTIPPSTPGGVAVVEHIHPTQLYETIACTILAILVARVAPGRGAASGWALVGYALWRAGNETLRGDYVVRLGQGQGFSLSPLHLTSAQWTALPLFILGVWMLLRSRTPKATS
ncbi:MAG: prolipoprotein diacylglyceryl transferase [Planctomycetota bacterium]